VAAEQHIAVIVDRFDRHAGLAQNLRAVSAPRAPERVVNQLDARLRNGFQIHQLGQPLEEWWLHIGGLKAARGGSALWNRCSRSENLRNRRLNLFGHFGQRRSAVVR
jgi:hypothetical protein